MTGATGFLGSAVVRRLLAAGEAVRVIARPGGDRRNLAGLDIDVREGDLLDQPSVRAALKGCTGLFHAAADYRLWAPNPEQMFRVNVDAAVRLIGDAMAAGADRIVHTSSVAVLGIDPSGAPADETTPVTYEDMIGPYKRSKFSGEEAVRKIIREQGAPVVIVNPSTPIGPRDVKPTPTGRTIVEAAAGRMPAYVETGLNVAHVDDVAEGHVLAWRKGRIGERYILGGGDMSLIEILSAAAKAAGRKPPAIRLPHGFVLPIAYMAEAWARISGREPFATVDGVRMARKKMFFSSAKAERELGYTHRPGADAIHDAVAWFKAEGYV
ncbi:MAG: hopanoid-associated sugar epimerase [Rhodospirillales bacterium]